jgi:uncharacterized low-complexity protein
MSNKLQTLTPIAAMLAMSLTGFAHAAEMATPAPMAMAMEKTADANCGANKKTHEAKCGIHKAAMGGMKEGKCVEAKCGADKGKKMEHGMVVESYVHKAAEGGMKEGKCGEAKCGADKGKKMAHGMVVEK